MSLTMLGAITAFNEIVSFGMTFYQASGGMRGILTGNSVAKRLDRVEAALEEHFRRLDKHLGACDVFEARQASGTSEVCEFKQIVEPMHAVQQDIGLELVHSQPIVSPDKFAQVFEDNPEKLLSNVMPLKSAEFDQELVDNPYLEPIIFDKWGVKFVGWIKTGVLELSLDAQYKPAVAGMVANAAVARVPRTAQPTTPDLSASNLTSPPTNAPESNWAKPHVLKTPKWQAAMPRQAALHYARPLSASDTAIEFGLGGAGFTQEWPVRVAAYRDHGLRVGMNVHVGGKPLKKYPQHSKVVGYMTPVCQFNGNIDLIKFSMQRSSQGYTDNFSITLAQDATRFADRMGIVAIVICNEDLMLQGQDGVLGVWTPL